MLSSILVEPAVGMSAYFRRIRSLVGRELLLCPGVTAVLVREVDGVREVLLVQRVDNGEWTPICGALEPDEEADLGAEREVLEETCVVVKAERALWIQTLPQTTYPNGDQVQYFDTAFLCRPIGGEAGVGDDESSKVEWFSEQALPPLTDRFRRTVDLALGAPEALRFGAGLRSLMHTPNRIGDG